MMLLQIFNLLLHQQKEDFILHRNQLTCIGELSRHRARKEILYLIRLLDVQLH